MPGISIYCFGSSALETGHRREPTPPEITTGISCVDTAAEEPNENLFSSTDLSALLRLAKRRFLLSPHSSK